MTICRRCHFDVFQPCDAARSSDRRKPIIVACDDELRRPSHFFRLGTAVKSLGMSRRLFADTVIITLGTYDGSFLWPEGATFVLTDDTIIRAFGYDADARWFSLFQKQTAPPIRQAQRRLVPRLRLLDAYFQITHPDIARHFYR